MKFYLLSISLVFLYFTSQGVAQSFKKGDWVIDAGVGIGNYGTITETTYSIDPFNNTPFIGSIGSGNSSVAMGSIIVPIKIEYGFSNKFGVGFKFGMNNFFVPREQNDIISSIRSYDFGIRLNYHFNSNKENNNDLFLELIIGSSKAKWVFNDNPANFHTSVEGDGGYFSLALNDRFYFSDHIGLLMHFGITRYYYPTLDNNYVLNAPPQPTQQFQTTYYPTEYKSFDAFGINLGIGLTVKL